MKLCIVSRELHPRQAFRISRARRKEVRNVFVRLEHEGIHGYGEASPNAFYNETAEGVTMKLEAARAWLSKLEIHSVAELEAAWAESWKYVAPSRAAQCAIDLALWDWLAHSQEKTVCELAWGQKPQPITTFCTIGLSTPEELEGKVAELAAFPRIKIKADNSATLDVVKYVRERSTALIAVDANCAWPLRKLSALREGLQPLNVAFVEQPLPPELDSQLPPKGDLPPLLADESCVTEDYVSEVAERFDGFNIKLVKCGGITPALRMARKGRELGQKMMVGCMLESSALIAAGAVVAQQTDYADLDGAWLIGDDPFHGWIFDRGLLRPPARLGLGVEPKEH